MMAGEKEEREKGKKKGRCLDLKAVTREPNREGWRRQRAVG